MNYRDITRRSCAAGPAARILLTLITLNPLLFYDTSLQTTDDQLEVVVLGTIGEDGSRFVADDSLSILETHSMGLAPIISSPVIPGLQNNFTIFCVEFETL